MNGGPRGPRDDFFCWKFRVWYNLRDCVYRHAWETHPDCADCAQGAANLKLLGRAPAPPRWAAFARAVGEAALHPDGLAPAGALRSLPGAPGAARAADDDEAGRS